MTFEIRKHALEVAAHIHTSTDEIIAAAEKFASFLASEVEAATAAVAGKKAKKAAAASEPVSTPPAETVTPPTTPAPVVPQQPAQPAAATNTEQLNKTTETVISLANDYSREEALGILGKVRNGRPGVTRCSDLNAADLVDVFNEATAVITRMSAAAAAAKANTSLI